MWAFPPQPDGVMSLGQVKREWKPSTGPGRYRRGTQPGDNLPLSGKGSQEGNHGARGVP